LQLLSAWGLCAGHPTRFAPCGSPDPQHGGAKGDGAYAAQSFSCIPAVFLAQHFIVPDGLRSGTRQSAVADRRSVSQRRLIRHGGLATSATFGSGRTVVLSDHASGQLDWPSLCSRGQCNCRRNGCDPPWRTTVAPDPPSALSGVREGRVQHGRPRLCCALRPPHGPTKVSGPQSFVTMLLPRSIAS